MVFGVLSLLFVFMVSPLCAATLRVERDGSGDFLFLQDCVDAAASGDTILVGSGIYDEWHLYGYSQNPVRMEIPDIEITVIGENNGSTIIGPEEPWAPGDPMHTGIALSGDSNVVLRNLQFRNLRSGVLSWAGANIAVFDCGFTDIWHSLFFDRGTGVVENCDFFNSDIDGLHLFSYFQSGLSISNCSFLQVDSDEVGHGIFVNISGEVDATISQCTFLGGGVGCQVDRGGNVDIFNSVFEDNTGHAVYLGTGGAYANVIDCRITNCYRGFLCFRTPYTLTVERTVFENIGMAAFVFNYLESGFVRDCLLDGGERGVVAYYPNQSPAEVNKSLVYDFDMRNNYWGTTDPDSIQILIEDNFDDPSIDYRVLWEPFLDQPVSSQKSTLESLKSRFR